MIYLENYVQNDFYYYIKPKSNKIMLLSRQTVLSKYYTRLVLSSSISVGFRGDLL